MSNQPNIERVRDMYSWTTAWRTEVPEGRERAEFDAALSAHDAEVRASALRDASSEIRVERFRVTAETSITYADTFEAGALSVKQMLLARSRAIDSGRAPEQQDGS